MKAMPRDMQRSAALLLTFASLIGGCSKQDSNPQPAAPSLPTPQLTSPAPFKITPQMNGDEIIEAAITAVGGIDNIDKATIGRCEMEVEARADDFGFKQRPEIDREEFTIYNWFDEPFYERRQVLSKRRNPRDAKLWIINNDDQWIQVNDEPIVTSKPSDSLLTYPNSFLDSLLVLADEGYTRVRMPAPSDAHREIVFVEIWLDGFLLAKVGVNAATALPEAIEKDIPPFDPKKPDPTLTIYSHYRRYGGLMLPTEILGGSRKKMEMTARVKSIEFLDELNPVLFDPPTRGDSARMPTSP